MNKIGFKVVRKTAVGSLVSALEYPDPWEVHYNPGRKTAPKFASSVLFAFETVGEAAYFRSLFLASLLEIWQAELEDPHPRPYLPRRQHHFKDFWLVTTRNGFLVVDADNLGPAPEGTLGCRSITLRRKVG